MSEDTYNPFDTPGKLFNYNLRNLMKSKNVTQVELAKVLGISQATISSWNKNKTVPKFEILKKIADYFGVSTVALTNVIISNATEIEQKKSQKLNRIREIKRKCDLYENLSEDEYNFVHEMCSYMEEEIAAYDTSSAISLNSENRESLDKQTYANMDLSLNQQLLITVSQLLNDDGMAYLLETVVNLSHNKKYKK